MVGDGSDRITDEGTSLYETDTLILQDLDYGNVSLSKDGNDLLIGTGASTIRIVGRFQNALEGRGIEKIVFQDGIVVEVLNDPVAIATVTGTTGNDNLAGWSFADHLFGGQGDDTLSGGNGNDRLEGGSGNDTLQGGQGADTYVWSRNSGTDRIIESDSAQATPDRLLLTGVLAEDVSLQKISDDDVLIVRVDGVVALRVDDQFDDASAFKGIEVIEFADGSSWNLSQIWEATSTIAASGSTTVFGSAWNDRLTGSSAVDYLYGGRSSDATERGDDTFEGAAGADEVHDDSGSETYVWSRGDGSDIYHDRGLVVTEVDRLVLRDVLSTEVDVLHSSTDSDLRVKILGTTDYLTFALQFLDTAHRGLDLIEFADGVIWTREDILDNTRMLGSSSNNSLTGSAQRDRIYGLGGSDTLSGLAGDDLLDGGADNDTLFGADGSDSYVWTSGGGDDTISDTGTSVTEIDILDLADTLSTDVELRRANGGGFLVVHILGTTDSVRIEDQFDGVGNGTGIEAISFADGVLWSLADIEAQTGTYGDGIATTLVGSVHGDNLFGTNTAETLQGNAGNDTLIGDGDADRIDGGVGIDIVSYRTATQGVFVDINLQGGPAQTGNAGGDEVGDVLISIEGAEGSQFADDLRGNATSDDLWGLGGDDTIFGYAGYDRIYGGAGNDRLYGQNNGDLLHGDAGNDSLYGGEGDDTLIGGVGNDRLYGDIGNDHYTVDATGDLIFEVLGEGTADRVITSISWSLAADDDIEELMTTDLLGLAAINLTGNLLSQTITGNAGDNILTTGGTNADTLIGGDGNDTYVVSVAGDDIVELAGGGGADTILTTHSRALTADQEIERLAVADQSTTSGINLTGNAFAQILAGNNGANLLIGGGVGGTDIFTGYLGNDDYVLSNSTDQVIEIGGQGAMDRIRIDATYILAADNDIECLEAHHRNWTSAINLTGNALAQTIIGNDGVNQLSDGGAVGADTLQGFAGNDTYIVRNAAAILIEGAGEGTQDRVRSTVSFVLASDDDIELFETSSPTGISAINLTANAHSQTVIGNDGANRLDSKGGNDTLTGHGGGDTFVFSTTAAPGNVDTITDFEVGSDTIELAASVFAALPAGALSTAAFLSNTSGQATNANHRVIFETDTGALFYDADGNGATARVQFAVVALGTALAATEFIVA